MKGVFAGILTEENRKSYIFEYDETYFNNNSLPPISLTLPKKQRKYQQNFMFAIFSNMIAEGENLAIQEKYLKIDPFDTISLLIATAQYDTIGAITIEPIKK
jgi:serine/threonine-protein kinase HipA